MVSAFLCLLANGSKKISFFIPCSLKSKRQRQFPAFRLFDFQRLLNASDFHANHERVACLPHKPTWCDMIWWVTSLTSLHPVVVTQVVLSTRFRNGYLRAARVHKSKLWRFHCGVYLLERRKKVAHKYIGDTSKSSGTHRRRTLSCQSLPIGQTMVGVQCALSARNVLSFSGEQESRSKRHCACVWLMTTRKLMIFSYLTSRTRSRAYSRLLRRHEINILLVFFLCWTRCIISCLAMFANIMAQWQMCALNVMRVLLMILETCRFTWKCVKSATEDKKLTNIH